MLIFKRKWQAVTVNGKLWGYRRLLGDSTTHYGQVQADDMAALRGIWYGDVMQYFSPVER